MWWWSESGVSRQTSFLSVSLQYALQLSHWTRLMGLCIKGSYGANPNAEAQREQRLQSNIRLSFWTLKVRVHFIANNFTFHFHEEEACVNPSLISFFKRPKAPEDAGVNLKMHISWVWAYTHYIIFISWPSAMLKYTQMPWGDNMRYGIYAD